MVAGDVTTSVNKGRWAGPWSSLVEGDEQLDWANKQTTLKLCHACVA